jgi:mannose/fructose-specific phosphotransferase system component IIA
MVGIVIACHLDMAKNILDTASYMLGATPEQVNAFSVELGMEKEEMLLGLSLATGEVDQGDGVLVLTDIVGGTPAMLAHELLGKRHIEVVSGVNLPMVLAVVSYRDGMSLKRLAKMAIKAGKESIFALK